MRTEDREILTDARYRLHGVVMALGQLIDQEIFRELEGGIDAVIAKISKRLKR